MPQVVIAAQDGATTVIVATTVEVGPTGPAGPPTLNEETTVNLAAAATTTIYTNATASNGIPTGLVVRATAVSGSTATAPIITVRRVSDSGVILPPTQLVGLNTAGQARVITFANTLIVPPSGAVEVVVLTPSSADTFSSKISLLGFEQAV